MRIPTDEDRRRTEQVQAASAARRGARLTRYPGDRLGVAQGRGAFSPGTLSKKGGADATSRRGAPASRALSASTGMKFVSPAQRGTTCACRCSAMPAPADLAEVEPDVHTPRAAARCKTATVSRRSAIDARSTPRRRAPSKSPTCRRGATSRCADVNGYCSGRRTRAAARRARGSRGASVAAYAQKTHPAGLGYRGCTPSATAPREELPTTYRREDTTQKNGGASPRKAPPRSSTGAPKPDFAVRRGFSPLPSPRALVAPCPPPSLSAGMSELRRRASA